MSRHTACTAFCSCAALLLVGALACWLPTVPGENESETSAPEPSDSGSTAPGILTAKPSGAEALSQHYVEVTFDAAVGAEAQDPSLYAIGGPGGAPLTIKEVLRPGTDATRVLLVTDKQEAVQYELVVQQAQPAAKIIRQAAPAPTMVVFAGSTAIEPFVSSAVALDPTTVLVTFGGSMDNNVLLTRNYEIVAPHLDVLDVQANNPATLSSVILTTSTQEALDYTIRITNVTTANGSKLIDPTRNTVAFYGIGPDTALSVTDAVATSATSVLVSFSKPLADDAASAEHFIIEPKPPFDGAPNLVIVSADMVRHNTQVSLTTLPMTPGWSYTVSVVGNVRDRARLKMLESPTQAEFLYVGLPCVTATVSLSSSEVLVIFDTTLDGNALSALNYVIANPDLEVQATSTAPRFANLEQTAVILETSEQEDIEYEVRVSNVTAGYGVAAVDPLHNTAKFNGTSPSGALAVSGAAAAGATTVLVSFNRPLADDAAESTHFTVEPLSPDSSAPSLVITAADMSRHNTQVRLTTTPMVAGWQYRVTVTGVREKQSRQPIQTPNAAAFTFIAAPRLVSATALSNTEVLMVYNATMDFTAARPRNYTISSPDLAVEAGAFADTWQTMVKLTTSSQEDVDYTVRASGSIVGGGGIPLDPAQSEAVFNGIGPDEGLKLDSAVPTGPTTVLLSFSRPLADDAAEPTYFKITSIPSEGNGATDLTLMAAELSPFATQVKLTTMPMVAGWSYEVEVVGNVRDRERRNAIESEADRKTQFTYYGPDPTYLPRVIGAISEDNTHVVVSFSKPMGDSALVAANYVIVQENVNPEVGALVVSPPPLAVVPSFTDTSRTAVRLTTSSQNEVTYRVRAVNVKDISGNSLAPQQLLVDPTSATFAGSPPGGEGGIFDSDGDGIQDNIEMRGYVVTVVGSDGESEQIQVTSNPFFLDTDADGLDDLTEKMIRTDPRNGDTDGDGLSDYDEYNVYYSSPTSQDTDDDGLDDNLEVHFLKTSPLFDDTDGDGLKDGDEINAGNRNPLIADLPEPGILIGEVALRLDTRFQYTDTEGNSQKVAKSNQATLHQSQERKFAQSDTETTKHELEAGFEGGYDDGAVAKGTVKYTFARENQFQASVESTINTQSEYQNTLSTEAQRDITQAVQRTVEGASIDLVVTLGNFSDIPFTMSNIEVTALFQDPYNRSKLSPIASLLPASMLTSNDFEVFLGPFIQERGPFIFKSTNVFPSLVEDLMKNPRGLIFKVANFDITDEQGRNFAYISQDVNDRTAGIIIDYGNGQVDKYRVATSSTFDEKGKPKGITMAYALQEILGMEKDGAENAIIVGDDGCAATFATGDDIQVVIPVCQTVNAGGTIVTAGPNGLLETLPLGDDEKSLDGMSIIDGGDGCAQTRAQRDDVQVVAAQCVTGGLDGIVVLAGKNGKIDTTPADGDELTAISGYATQYLGQCGSEPGSTSYDYIVEPRTGGDGYANTQATGDDEQLVALDDSAKPGQPIIGPGPNGDLDTIPGGDEITACRPIERLVRVKGVKDKPEQSQFWALIGPPDMEFGIDFDALPLKAGNVYTLAYVQDQDHDGLYAREEFLYASSDRDDNSDGCPLGDGNEGCDLTKYDFDTVWDFDEVRTGWLVQVAGQSSYVTYSNPVQPDSDADRLFDDQERAMGTDAGKRDTDDDGISDYDEVEGYQIVRRDGVLIRNVVPYQSAIITAGNNGTLDTTRLIKDDLLNTELQIITPGPNGVLDSLPDGDDVIEGTAIILDGGNGEPETVASGDDIQVSDPPVPTRTVKVTFMDFEPGSSSGDAEGPGEFVFNLFARKGEDDTVEAPLETALVSAYGTHTFGSSAVFNFLEVAPTDTISFGAEITEDDPVCGADTRDVIIEPLTGGDGLAQTAAAGDDTQVVALGGFVSPGGIVVSSCPPLTDGVLDSTANSPGLCEPVDIIIAGPNRTADTTAAGDDVQIKSVGTAGLDPNTAVVGPGPNGQIDTTPASDDAVASPVVTPYPCEPVIIEPLTGGDGVAVARLSGDDIRPPGVYFLTLVAPGHVLIRPGPNGVIDSTPAVDERVIIAGDGTEGTTQTADTTQAMVTGDDIFVTPPSVVSWNTILVRPGPNGVLDTTPATGDTLAIAEPLTGGNNLVDTVAASTDLQLLHPITEDPQPGEIIITTGSDKTLETQITPDILVPAAIPLDDLASSCPSGVRINTADCDLCPTGQCYGDDVRISRAAGDSCEQTWITDDPLACPCGACLKYNSNPPSTFERWTPEQVTLNVSDIPPGEEGVTVTLSNGPGSFGAAMLRVKITVTPGATVTPGDVVVRPGPDGKLDTVPAGDDIIGVPHLTRYASNPLDRDTDADTLFDGAERILGSNPNDALDAQRYRDNDLDGLPNWVETDGWVLGYTDDAGVLQCLTAGGTMTVEDEYDPPTACLRVTSDPFDPDTDFDGLPDLLEFLVHADPRSPDTDGDGLLDYDEFDPKSRFSVPTLVIREFQRRCAEAPRCVYTPAESPHGTSIVLADTDTDGLTDRQEVEEYWIIAPCSAESGYAPGLPRQVFSSPVTADFDLDNLLDGQEKALLLDPLDPDTDGDGKPDNSDGTPDGCGKIVTITFLSYAVDNNCQATGKGDFKFRFTVRRPHGDDLHFDQDFSLGENSTHTFPSSFTATFTMRDGDTFGIDGQVKEPDSASADEVWTLNERVYDYSVADAEVVIGPETGEPYAGCYGNHKLTLQFVVGQD